MRTFGVNTIVYLFALSQGKDQTDLVDHIQKNGGQIAEVRREFIQDGQLETIAERAGSLAMSVYYSVPEPLFVEGAVNTTMLKTVMAEAEILKASCVKFSLGDIRGVADETIQELSSFLEAYPQDVLIENGPQGPEGDAHLLDEFFTRQDALGGNVGLTFDSGNFAAAGFDPLLWAKMLAKRTRWIHLKDAKEVDGKVVHPMLGQGDIDFVSLLQNFDPQTPAAIEYPCADYDVVAKEMGKAIQLLKDIE